jgi:general secretion pathway protein C
MKRYFWLLYLLLVTAAAALAAGIVNAHISAQLAAPLKPTQTRASSTSGPLAQKAALTHYEVITKRNIFNANPPSETPAPPTTSEPPPPAPPPPATPLQLKLVGVVAGTNATRFAILESTGNPPGQAVYQVGDMVQQAVIVDIRPDCAVLERQGRRESLCFQQDTGTTPAPQSAAPAPAARQSAATPAPAPAPATAPGDTGGSNIVRVDPGTWRVSRELVLENFANVGSLAAQATVTPYFVQGQQQGFRLSRMQAGGVLQQIGLQEGDVLQKVNGLNIHSPQEALQAYQQLQTEATVRLNIIRNNRPTTLTYELR